MISSGKFIVIEGQGFTGKTTQALLLVEKLRQKGIEVIETREPGGVPEAEEIRQELLKRREQGLITPEKEVELFYKSRKLFLEKLVKPALSMGKWIVTTRFSPSTFVYQGIEGGVPQEKIEQIDKEVVGDFKPDLIILLDIPEEEILKRMAQSSDREKHAYNEHDKEIVKTRRQGYLKLAKENIDGNWKIIDATGTKDQISELIFNLF